MPSTRHTPLSIRSVLHTAAAGVLLVAGCGGSAGGIPTGGAVLDATATPAAVSNQAGPSAGAFHLTKTCSGFSCVVASSSLAAIPVGTSISYRGSPEALAAVIHGPDGTATGTCNIAVTPGSCAFSTGTGSLAGIRLAVAVTTDSTGAWHWDGTYSFGPGA